MMHATMQNREGIVPMKSIVIALTLVAAAPLAAQQPAGAAGERKVVSGKPDARICKRSAPSGSLVQTRRECHTRSEWNRLAQAGREQAQDLVDRATPTGQ
jgi:hypothetical protein